MKLEKIKLIYFAYLILFMIIAVIATIAYLRHQINFNQLIGGFLIINCFAGLASFPLGLSWWRQIDEAAREAHKIAWFWGGSIGMTIAILIAAINLYFDGVIIKAIGQNYHVQNLNNYGFEIGIITVIFFMGWGYMINWLFWWKQKGA